MSEGKKEILLGDCLELMKDIQNGSIDMILCDLPYGTTACKWDTIIPFEPLWEQYKRIIKPNGAIVLTASQPFTSALVMSNPKLFKHQWQWIKNKPTGAFGAKYMPMKANEDVLVFGLNKVNYYPQMVKRTEEEFKSCYRKNDSKSWGNNIQNHKDNLIIRKPKDEQWFKYPTNILNISKDDKRDGTQHPTQKPIALFEYLVKTYSKENDLVLDNCAGSGTTAIACLKTNRQFIVMEQDPNYFEKIKKRVGDFNKNFEPKTLFDAPNEALRKADVISSFACFDEDNECTEQCGLCKHVQNGIKQANGL